MRQHKCQNAGIVLRSELYLFGTDKDMPLPKITFKPAMQNIGAKALPVQGTIVTYDRNTYFFADKGNAIIRSEGAIRNGGGYWYNAEDLAPEKGYRVSSPKLWAFHDNQYRQVDAAKLEPHLISALRSYTPDAQTAILTTTDPKFTCANMDGMPRLIAGLPLYDQYRLMQAHASVYALKKAYVAFVGERDDIKYKRRERHCASDLKYRNPNHPPTRFASPWVKEVYYLSGLLCNAFKLRWAYNPFAGRLYADTMETVTIAQVKAMTTIEPKIGEKWEKFRMRHLDRLKIPPSDLDRARLHIYLKSGGGDLLGDANVADSTLGMRASYYRHQLRGWFASIPDMHGPLIPMALRMAIDPDMVSSVNRPMHGRDVTAWAKRCDKYLTDMGAVDLYEDTPYVPIPESLPRFKPFRFPSGPSRRGTNLAIQRCLSDEYNRARYAELCYGVVNALLKGPRQTAIDCESAMADILIELDEVPTIVIRQPSTTGKN